MSRGGEGGRSGTRQLRAWSMEQRARNQRMERKTQCHHENTKGRKHEKTWSDAEPEKAQRKSDRINRINRKSLLLFQMKSRRVLSESK
jgi:hypothetical protein